MSHGFFPAQGVAEGEEIANLEAMVQHLVVVEEEEELEERCRAKIQRLRKEEEAVVVVREIAKHLGVEVRPKVVEAEEQMVSGQ